MIFLYDIGIRLYVAAVWLASFFNRKAALWIEGRKGLFDRLQRDMGNEDSVVWIHCASLGEFEQGRPLIESWKEHFPETCILVTFFSPSGYEIRKDFKAADYVYYLPLDTRKNARRFYRIVNPRCAVFVKYEFWPHFLRQGKRHGTKLFLVSANFRAGQLFFKPWGRWYRKLLTVFTNIFVQDENSMQLLSTYPDISVSIAGDTRFDRVAEIAKESKPIKVAHNFSSGRFTFVLGSTWAKDEKLLLDYIHQDHSDACYILAPHEIGAMHIQQLMDRLGEKAILYSQASEKRLPEYKVLVIDNIGMLSSLYRYGDVAYVGGGFGKGIHNILEPAVYGIPVLFGPKYEKFREAVELVIARGAFPVGNYEALRNRFDDLQGNKKMLRSVSQATQQFMHRNVGATEAIIQYIKKTY